MFQIILTKTHTSMASSSAEADPRGSRADSTSNRKQENQDGDGDLLYDNAFPQLASSSGGRPVGVATKTTQKTSTVTKVILTLIPQ